MKLGEDPPEREAAAESEQSADEQPSYKNVPGPCHPEDLLDGVIFGAKYLGSTQIKSEKNPWTNAGMAQAQEAVDRIKAPEGESQPMTEVDLFISTQRITVLTADTQKDKVLLVSSSSSSFSAAANNRVLYEFSVSAGPPLPPDGLSRPQD